jgi:hypothetical protein
MVKLTFIAVVMLSAVGQIVRPPAAPTNVQVIFRVQPDGGGEQSSTLCTDAGANARYVKPSSSGTGSGTSWSNALGASWTPVRGLTYCLADGTYTNKTLSVADSGTTTITIVKATTTDHGATANGGDDGWVSTMGDGQALFDNSGGGGIVVESNYWVIDGAVGSLTSTQTAYGFWINQPSNCSQNHEYVSVENTNIHHVTVSHIGFVGCGAAFNFAQSGFALSTSANYKHDLTFSHFYCGDVTLCFNVTNMADSTIEYGYWAPNWSSSEFHGEQFGINNCHTSDGGACSGASSACTQGLCTTNLTIRYNIIEGCNGTGCIVMLGPGNVASAPNIKIYGNVIRECGDVGDGLITNGGDNFVLQGALVYNNTIGNCGESTLMKTCDDTTGKCSSATGNVFKNNMSFDGPSGFEIDTGPSIDKSHNSYCGTPNDVPASETGRQYPCGDLFVDSASGDFRLDSDTDAWTSLSSPYNTDLDGVTRTSSRGAYQYVP